MKNFIKINNLNYHYGKIKVLENIYFNIEGRNFVSIVGANGSGKTTLLKNIAKILSPQKNQIFVNDKDINDYSYKEFSRIVSYVPQFINIEFNYKVIDIILMGRTQFTSIYGKISNKDYEICLKALKLVQSEHLIDRDVTKLSGGERQKVFIAKALAQQTPIILLDEPISHLDLKNQIEILDILKGLSRNDKLIVTILHDLNLANIYSDYVIMLKKGEIFCCGEPNSIINEVNIKNCYEIDVKTIGENFFIPVSITQINTDYKKD
ncbi:MAG: hypothetical protein A2086_04635 [Spirochaetes bacterium GWD1_27_9]|nr:MAG: hypothetical protein A2Z98_02840 [Spirochaetes bacterium GWB1_27_13]OHD27055.1 MAG: hypothetical protein A2Y34_18435 [Spirochaetes bacterium GWC1_27_15]OHD35639.1 MAG: hypothetical protein A2086_04635 [Spirochaetes bacterium GWD1_27_9]